MVSARNLGSGRLPLLAGESGVIRLNSEHRWCRGCEVSVHSKQITVCQTHRAKCRIDRKSGYGKTRINQFHVY